MDRSHVFRPPSSYSLCPSPTGYLHIGGVRTALFNYLFAKRHGGQFLLRIDDTDQQRNIDEALAPILHGFRWLGIDWDEGPEVGGPYAPYFQSKRLPQYQAAVEKLLAGRLPTATMPRRKKSKPNGMRLPLKSGLSSTVVAGWPKRWLNSKSLKPKVAKAWCD